MYPSHEYKKTQIYKLTKNLYRLRDLKMQFNQLTEMFSQDQNQKIFREILMKVI